MGRSITPKYRVEAKEQNGKAWAASWRGRATEKRLAEYVAGTNESMKPGGVNEHVSRAVGFIPVIREARIIEQRTGEIVAHYKAPLFQVF